jgi:hypothetical protein
MKIAQIAPLYESVPPKLYGGTERIVSYLTEELVICPRNNISYKPAIAASQALLILRNTSVPLARHT